MATVNDYNDKITLKKDEYLFRLIPDLSVFDLAEKNRFYNGDTAEPLFSFFDMVINVNSNFYRALFRIDNKDAKISGINEDTFYYEFISDGRKYLIMINDFNKCSFTLSEETNVIGVCF